MGSSVVIILWSLLCFNYLHSHRLSIVSRENVQQQPEDLTIRRPVAVYDELDPTVEECRRKVHLSCLGVEVGKFHKLVRNCLIEKENKLIEAIKGYLANKVNQQESHQRSCRDYSQNELISSLVEEQFTKNRYTQLYDLPIEDFIIMSPSDYYKQKANMDHMESLTRLRKSEQEIAEDNIIPSYCKAWWMSYLMHRNTSSTRDLEFAYLRRQLLKSNINTCEHLYAQGQKSWEFYICNNYRNDLTKAENMIEHEKFRNNLINLALLSIKGLYQYDSELYKSATANMNRIENNQSPIDHYGCLNFVGIPRNDFAIERVAIASYINGNGCNRAKIQADWCGSALNTY